MTRSATPRAALASIALAAGAVALAFTWQPGLATFHDDSASYLVMAQAYSPWQPASAPVAAQAPFEKYPPLFPLAIALLGAAYDWQWAHAIVALSFAAAVFLLGVYATRIGGSWPCGIAAAILFAALPGAWLNLKGILSEFPYMALTFGTLAWLARRAPGTPFDRRHTVAMAALLAAVMLTRTIGFTLVLAIGIAEAASYRRTLDSERLREIVLALASSVAAVIVWYVLRPSGGDDAYVSSSAVVLERVRSDGLAYLGSLALGNASALFDAWLNALVIYWGEAWQPKFLGGALIALAMAAATLARARRVHADAIYVLLFLAVLIAWPFPGQMYRLALPVFPIALAIALAAVPGLTAKRLDPRACARTAGYAALVPLAFCVPALFYIAERARQPGREIMEYYRIPFRPDAESAAALQSRAFGDMAHIRETTPAGASVMWYGPAYIALLASRRGVPLDYPQDAKDMAAQLARARPDFVYLSRVHPRDSARRLGDPLAPARQLESLADAVWWRPGPDGKPEAALFAVHKEAR
jgi:hypothetical protein